MDPKILILKAAIASSTVLSCQAPNTALSVHVASPEGIPVETWPEKKERPESPHLPHEELRVTVDSGASGTNTTARLTHFSSFTQLSWLRNELGENFIVLSAENFREESRLTRPNPHLRTQQKGKQLKHTSTPIPRARSGC
jgi:hypothetical protein